jgi:hypothetical protein
MVYDVEEVDTLPSAVWPAAYRYPGINAIRIADATSIAAAA